MNSSEVTRVLQEVAVCYAMHSLTLDDDGQAAFELADGLVVTIRMPDRRNANGLLAVELSSINASVFEPTAQMLLVLNGRLLDTEGATFGLHPAKDSVLVLLPFSAGALEPTSFVQIVQRLVALARQWNGRLQRCDVGLSVDEWIPEDAQEEFRSV